MGKNGYHTPPITFYTAISLRQGGVIRGVRMTWGGIWASNRTASVELRDSTFSNTVFQLANATFARDQPCYISNGMFYLHGNVDVYGAQDSTFQIDGDGNVISNCGIRSFACFGDSNSIESCRIESTVGDVQISGNGNAIRRTVFGRQLQNYSTIISGDGNTLEQCVAYSNLIGFAVTGNKNVMDACQAYWNVDGVKITGNSNVVRRSFIGVDAAGTAVFVNTGVGVEVRGVGNVLGGGQPEDRNIICGSGSDAIKVVAARNTRILKNWIGLALDGTNGLGNTGWGVAATGCSNLYIGDYLDGNVFASNRNGGVFLDRCTNTVVMDNYIGADRYGLRAVGNHGAGVHAEQCRVTYIVANTIVDTKARSSSYPGHAVYMWKCSNAYVWANNIGVNVLGTNVQSNAGDGVYLDETRDVLIGGVNAYDRNVVVGGSNGVVVAYVYDNSALVRILNNYIGVDRTGTNVVGNRMNGIMLEDVSGVQIGGSTLAERNVIAGSGCAGILVLDGDDYSISNVIQGNFIGTDATGTGAAGNHDGVLLVGPQFTRVGGTEAGAGNLIAHNRGHGVSIQKRWYDYPLRTEVRGNLIRNNVSNGVNIASGVRNVVSSNAIYGNSLMGINLGAQGRNDGPESDTQANRYQRYPFISNVVAAGGTRVRGSLTSAASKTYRLEFFATPGASPAGFGEGQEYLGATDVTTDGSGRTGFDVLLPVAAQPGWIVTATARDPDGNTSELCEQKVVNGVTPDFRVNKTLAKVGEAVQFTDLSLGGPVSWYWDFDNDGTVDSTAQNPTYAYTSTGDKTVKLTASNQYGAASETKVALVRVMGATFAVGPGDDVQAVINASQPFDTILLSAGVFRVNTKGPGVNVFTVAKPVTIVGLDGPGAVVIDGEGARRCLHVISGRVVNVTCVNGVATNSGTKLSASVGESGGGVLLEAGEMERCIVRNCRAVEGGGVKALGGGWLRSCLIVSNGAQEGGGLALGSGVVACNLTIADNAASVAAGGVLLAGGELWNSIVVRNTASTNENWQRNDGSINYSCAQPHPGGFDSTDIDPGLAADYTIAMSSPVADGGYEFDWMSSARDLAGDVRVYGTAPDMGAYEAVPEAGWMGVVGVLALMAGRKKK